MRVLFRTDASVQIGSGHVMRCLTLADALRAKGAHCEFACREHSGHIMGHILRRGYQVHRLPHGGALSLSQADTLQQQPAQAAPEPWLHATQEQDAEQFLCVVKSSPSDLIIVDHYSLDERWEATIRRSCRQLIVIDDLADRAHDCNLLLDQNPGRVVSDYDGLLPMGSTALIGPMYALLRPEFPMLRAESLARRAYPQLSQILVTMGGVDKDNATGLVLGALIACSIPKSLRITVVMGPSAPWLEQVQEQAVNMQCPTRVLVGVNNMAQLMAGCDLAIGAAGGTALERCCLGLPSLLLVLAENQRGGAAALQKAGAAILMNNANDIADLLQSQFLSKHAPQSLKMMITAAAQITDGNGVFRVTQHLMDWHD